MSINELLRSAILPIVPVCEPGDYDGDASEYCTFQYDDSPEVFAEGAPDAIRYPVILNWYLPHGVNPLKKKVQIRRAIVSAGFTYPYTTNLSDNVSQRFMFEFEHVDGDV